MKLLTRFAIVFSLGCLASCAHVGPSSPDSLYLHSTDAVIEARVDPNEIVGPAMQVNRYPDAMRGRVFNRPFETHWTAQEVTGQINGRPVQLHLDQQGDEVHAKGLWGGRLSDFRLSPEMIEGSVGNCGYSLRVQDNLYQGFRSCHHQRVDQPVVVQLPQNLQNSPMGEKVASVSILLAQ